MGNSITTLTKLIPFQIKIQSSVHCIAEQSQQLFCQDINVLLSLNHNT